jgi:penicillin-binding protein 1A
MELQSNGSRTREVISAPAQRARPWKRPWWWANVVVSVVLAFVAAHMAVEWTFAQVPMPPEARLPSSARVYDVHGNLIATYRDEVTRFIVDTRDLPDHVGQAVVAAEDRTFYDHEGVDLAGMARAAWANLTSGTVEQGGSTITQQYIKNAVLEDSSRTMDRKIKEGILAIKLERTLSKEKILDSYLNTVYFGRGAYGIEAAARTYFAKHARQLKLVEAAYLAGIIPAPGAYQTEETGLARRHHVLTAMRAEGYITQAEFDKADNAKLRFATSPQLRDRHQPAAYFMEWLRKDFLYPRFGECLYRCGLKIYTTIDMDMQADAENAVSTVLDEEGDPPAALVSMTPSGEVRAMVGGPDYTNVRKARGYNFATDGKRQAGSSFKPFTLLQAIEEGISPSSRFSGESPKTIDDPTCTGPDGVWEPENYGGSSYGTLDLRSATANSVNTVFAELITEVGAADVADLVQRFGFTGTYGTGEIEPNCSLALGTLDVSVLEMARAYAGFAARGNLPEATPLRYVQNRSGKCLLGYGVPDKMNCKKVVDTGGTQVVDQNSADVLTETLTGVVEAGTATSAQIGRPVAGKTGTTQDNRDSWFAGYTPQLATVVWMGYPIEAGPDGKKGTADDISPLMHYCGTAECRPVHGIDVTGGSFPAEIWSAFMSAALEGAEIMYFPTPAFEPTTVLNPPPPPAPVEPAKEEHSPPADAGDNGGGHDKKG